MTNLKRNLALSGLAGCLVLGLTAGYWSGQSNEAQKRRQEILRKIPTEPGVLINVEAEDLPGTDDLTKLGRAATAALRAGMLGNVNDNVRARCAWMLAWLRDPAAMGDLVHALRDRSGEVRTAALEALGALDATEPVPAIVEALGDTESNAWIRAGALRTLGRLGDPRALKAIEGYINDEDDDTLLGAALSALWEMRNIVGFSTIEKHYLRALQFENGSHRVMLINWLGKMKSRAAVPVLIDLFSEVERYHKNRIIVALGDIGDARAADFLVDYLRKTQDGRLMNNAAIALAKVGGKAQAMTELNRLMADPKAYVRVNAAFVLGEIGDAAAFPTLTAALKDQNDFVRSEACVALGRIGDQTVVPALEAAAADWNRFVRRDAIVALNRIDFPRFRGLLVDKLLNDDVPVIRARALRLLAEKRDPAVLQALMRNLRSGAQAEKLEAVRALVGMPQANTAELVPALLYQLVSGYSTDIRGAVLQAVREQQIGAAAPMLVEIVHHAYGQHLQRVLFTIGRLKVAGLVQQLPALGQIEDRADRLYLAFARAMHGDGESLKALLAGLSDGSVDEKRDAGFLLGKLDDKNATEALSALLTHSDPLVALHAGQALLGRDFATRAGQIYTALASPRPNQADEAERVFAKLGSDDVDTFLQEKLKTERRWFMRQRVADILEVRRDKEFR